MVHQILLYAFWRYVIRFINIHNCYILNWSFHYSLAIFYGIKTILSDINKAAQFPFLFVVKKKPHKIHPPNNFQMYSTIPSTTFTLLWYRFPDPSSPILHDWNSIPTKQPPTPAQPSPVSGNHHFSFYLYEFGYFRDLI